MEKMCWTDHVKNEEGLHRVKGKRNILRKILRRKANLIGHYVWTWRKYWRSNTRKDKRDGQAKKKT